jgi:hypothetical protein
MKVNKLFALLGATLALSAVAFSGSAFADASAVTVGNATTNLDFTITIPRTLSFRVGTNTAGTIDQITFSPTAAQVGSGTAITGAGGDLGAGVVTARVVGNANSQITIKATTAGALSNGAGATISWAQITTTTATATSATALAAPTLVDAAAGTTVNAPAPIGGVTIADAKWTFQYANTTVPSAGVYGGTTAKNSRVTYTAAMP